VPENPGTPGAEGGAPPLRAAAWRPAAVLARLLPPDARLPVALAFGVVLIALGGAVLNDRAGGWLMRAENEATARAWAADLDDTLGDDLPALLARTPPSAAARTALARARHVGEVFRYKLFDEAGRLVFVSDDLADPDRLDSTLAAHRGSAGVAAAILAGGSHVAAARGIPPERPAFYAEAYVPAYRDGRIVGIAEVYVDQTARQARYGVTFLAVEAAIAVLVLLAGLPSAFAAWRRTRQQRAAEARVRFLAMHDGLTGLPNRTHFSEALAAALSGRRKGDGAVAAIALDLDRFKEVNDSLGHAAGDALLQAVAARLRAELREGDVVARLGGDEFTVAQVGEAQPAAAARLAQRLVAVLSEPFDLPGGHRVTTGASAGIAVAPADADGPDALLRAADAALYRAKADGRGVARCFEPAMDAELSARRRLTQDLRTAVADNGFDLAYQPLHRLSDGALVGFEALLRWPHPERGMVPPDTFIPIAEETGLIVPIGAWVLRRACAAAAAGWPDGLSVAVNLSPVQFRRGADLVATVRDALAVSGLPAHRLELEITEGLLLHDAEAALATLTELRGLGCAIAMDDFGTGYSSLGSLWRFPFDKLKIDRSFVLGMEGNPKAAAIVSSVVALGRALGLIVTAEGVETAAQAASLRDAGCTQGQGFLLGRPASIAAVSERFAGAAAASPAGVDAGAA